jgi:hypothetical protein
MIVDRMSHVALDYLANPEERRTIADDTLTFIVTLTAGALRGVDLDVVGGARGDGTLGRRRHADR